MHKNVLFGLLILSTHFLNLQTTTAQCHIDDWTALKALYESTDGDNWFNNTDWQQVLGNTPATNCDLSLLYGVRLDAQGRVDELTLSENQLSGSIPPELDNLSNLKYLHLANNLLIGNIPPEFGNLSNLNGLWLHSNDLIGNIPPELGNLSNLNGLWLYSNDLIGSIPPELGNLSNLQYLQLANNLLSGSIPSELGNLSNLQNLKLYSNQLSGSIPPEVGNLSNLQDLKLYSNQLSSGIPPELGNLSNLQYLRLDSNKLIGTIPRELGNLSNLEILWLEENQLSGNIPPEFGNLSNLDLLDINDNDLSGCYSDNLTILCTQLTHGWFEGDADISVGNNFDASWEEFCASETGSCIDDDDCEDDCETFVYPGDLNNDGIVNNQDISLSGLFLYQAGIPRATEHQNINWSPHPSQDWNILNNQDKDIKHHDCNGDGTIDEADQQAVENNLGLTWDTPPPPNPPDESDYQVMLQPTDQIYDGNLVMNVSLERRAGGNLTLQGGHFTVDYSDIEGNFSFVGLNFVPISWLGTPNNNLWYESTHFPSTKKIEVGFTKTNNVDSEGSGIIGQLILEYDNSLARQAGASNISYNFEVNAIGVHQNNGEFIPIEDQQLEIIIDSDICYSNLIIDEEAPFQNLYKSTNTITTNDFVIIGADQKVELNANWVRINSGFSAKTGADFKVRNNGCN